MGCQVEVPTGGQSLSESNFQLSEKIEYCYIGYKTSSYTPILRVPYIIKFWENQTLCMPVAMAMITLRINESCIIAMEC